MGTFRPQIHALAEVENYKLHLIDLKNGMSLSAAVQSIIRLQR